MPLSHSSSVGGSVVGAEWQLGESTKLSSPARDAAERPPLDDDDRPALRRRATIVVCQSSIIT